MNRTILIVDDEAHLRTLIHQALEDLEDEGVELLTAANDEEALATIQSARPGSGGLRRSVSRSRCSFMCSWTTTTICCCVPVGPTYPEPCGTRCQISIND